LRTLSIISRAIHEEADTVQDWTRRIAGVADAANVTGGYTQGPHGLPPWATLSGSNYAQVETPSKPFSTLLNAATVCARIS
jgi:hypothetical protein